MSLEDLTPENLKELYINQNLSSRQIAKKLNLNKTTILKYIKKYSLEKPLESKVEYTLLKKLYLDENLSTRQIAIKLGKGATYIKKLVKEYNLTKSKEAQIASMVKNVKQTNLERYGVESSLQRPEIKEKIKQTFEEKYENGHPMKDISTKEKHKQTCLKNLGTENALLSPEVLSKIKQTNLERYEAENCLSNNEVREQIYRTNLEKYGSKSPLGSKEVQEKVKNTLLKKYGTENPMQNSDIRQKVQQTNLKRYKATSPLHNPEKQEEYKTKAQQTNLKKYGTENSMKNLELKAKFSQTILEKYGVPYYCMTEDCKEAHGGVVSKLNLLWQEELQNLGYSIELEKQIENKSYDLRIQGTNILLEINPTATHNSAINIFSVNAPAKDKDYHYQKSKLATEKGYHCIHVWDWDDKQKILNLLKKKEKIQGRKTEVKKLSIQEADIFNNKYHLQNTCKGQKVILGLYYNNTLISLMSFGKPRYNKNYQWELLRYTTHPDYMVLGGAKKIFKHFIKEYTPDSVVTYCDYSKFSGQVYKKLGFKYLRHNSPSCHWIKGQKRITQAQLSKYGFDKLLGKEYGEFGKGTNNQELMLQHGFLSIYDCGQLVFEWKKA